MRRVPTSAPSQLGLHLPLAPDGAAAAFGVVVEEAAADVVVKVRGIAECEQPIDAGPLGICI